MFSRILTSLIRRPVAVSMVMLVIVATGIVSAWRLPLELTPKAELPRLSVHTAWPNASPEAVEAFVTAPIEGVVAGLPGVQKLTSTSREGQSTVEVAFSRDTRVDFAALQLSEQLAIVREHLPHGAGAPRIQKYVPEEFRQEAFLQYQLAGPYSLYDIRQMALKKLRTPLLAVPGVADVQVQGGQDAEIHILLDRRKVQNFGLRPQHIRQALQDLNLRLQGGLLRRPADRRGVDLLVLNPVHTLEELRNLPLRAGKTRLRLKDVATVERAYQNVRQLVRIDGNPAVSLVIHREPGSNTIAVANTVFRELERLMRTLPPGMRLLKIYDESARIRRDLRALSTRSIFCLLVILLVLLAFLRTLHLPLLVMSTVAIAILLTLNLFYFAGLTLNILTLAGLALGFGMLVDNAIVVMDNIHRLREEGMEATQAAVQGTQEMLQPLAASTLTTVVVFLPALYMTGELRVYYIPFILAVCLSLLSSLVIALLFAPMVAARVAPAVRPRESRLLRAYRFLLRKALAWPLVVLVAAGGLFYFSYDQFDKNVTRGEIWRWDGDTYLICWARLPRGAELQRADDIARTFEEKVVGLPGVKRVSTYVYPERVRIRIDFPKAVQLSAYPLILKEQLSVLASRFAGVAIGVYGFGPGFSTGLGGSAPNFRIQVLGYNYNEVKRIAEAVGRKLQRNPRVRDINTSGSGYWWSSRAHTETVLRVKRDRLPAYGLTVAEVLDQVTAYLRENQGWQRLVLGKEELEYRVKFADFRDFDFRDLFNVVIYSSAGKGVRLPEVTEIVEQPVQSEIVRENQQYQRWVTFEYRGPYKFGQRLVDAVIKNTALPPGYKLKQPKWFLSAEEKKLIYWVLALSLLLVFMVTAALYESLIQPFIVMLTVPLALIGVFLVFWLTETNFDRSAYIGVILLSGIVVNNAILMVERITRLRRQGLPVREAIVRGAEQRIRPILMTTATTVFGLVPLVLSGGESELWGTLALSTIGGLSSSAALILFVTPALYRLLVRR